LNNLGYRGDQPSIHKKEGEYRVFVVGGSTVFMGSPTIPEILENIFHENGYDNVNVYNFGTISSVSGMELALLVYEISDFKPDLVIFYNGINDIDLPNTWDPRPGYPMNFIVYENHPLLESDLKRYPLIPLIAYGSNILRYLKPDYFTDEFIPLDKTRKEVRYGSDQWRNEIGRKYVNHCYKAYLYSKAINAQFIAFFQPSLYFRDHMTEYEKKIYNQDQAKHYIASREKVRHHYKEYSKDNSDFKLIDISDIYDNYKDPVFKDRMHTFRWAKDIVAKEIFGHIKEYVPNDL